MSSSDITKTTVRKTMEQSLSVLAEYLGTTDEQLIKMFSILDEDDIRKKSLMFGDITNYPKICCRLKPYAFQDLFLNCSLNGKRAEQVTDIIKSTFQAENQPDKTRLQKLADLFR